MLYNCKAIVRGLRGLSDYDYEVQLSQINKDISQGEVNTICFFADQKYQFISSSVVKEVFNFIVNILTYETVENFYPEKIYKDIDYKMDNYPENITYSDMSNNGAEEKERLLEKWVY